MDIGRHLSEGVDRQLGAAEPDVREGVSRGDLHESSATRPHYRAAAASRLASIGGVIDGLPAAVQRGLDHLDRLDDLCAELG